MENGKRREHRGEAGRQRDDSLGDRRGGDDRRGDEEEGQRDAAPAGRAPAPSPTMSAPAGEEPGVEPLDGVGRERVGDDREEGAGLIEGHEPQQRAHRGAEGAGSEHHGRPERPEEDDVGDREVDPAGADPHDDEQEGHGQQRDDGGVGQGEADQQHRDGDQDGDDRLVGDEPTDAQQQRQETDDADRPPHGGAEPCSKGAHRGPPVTASSDAGRGQVVRRPGTAPRRRAGPGEVRVQSRSGRVPARIRAVPGSGPAEPTT